MEIKELRNNEIENSVKRANILEKDGVNELI